MASARRLLISMCSSGGRWTLVLPGLLLLLPGLVSSFPTSSGTNAASLGRMWERLFSVEKSELRWESDYLLGIRRARRLYCNVGIGFHLQVLPDGRISGVHSDNQYSLIEISAVARGVVSLYGVKSEMFVAMNSRGKLYGTRSFREECKFKETLLPNNYNAYESSIYKGYYVALSKHGRLKRGFKASPAMTVTHFLPRL